MKKQKVLKTDYSWHLILQPISGILAQSILLASCECALHKEGVGKGIGALVLECNEQQCFRQNDHVTVSIMMESVTQSWACDKNSLKTLSLG